MRHSGYRSDPGSRLSLPLLLASLISLVGTHSAHAFTRNAFPPTGIAIAIEGSSPGDTVLVNPGVYTWEWGVRITHSLTIIGVGGASDNEIRICPDTCPEAFLDVQPQVGPVFIQGLTMKRSHMFFGYVHGVRADNAQNLTVRDCVFTDLGPNANGVLLYGGTALIQGNLFLLDGPLRIPFGGGEIIGNTFVSTGIRTGDTAPATPRFSGNIFYATSVVCEDGDPIFACNNSWQSIYTGCPNLSGVNNNFTADPLLCDPDAGDYRLLPNSPCLPENSPVGCGLVGAYGSCAVLAVNEPSSVPSLSRLEVSPNPSSGEVVFSLPGVTSPRVLEIFDAQGRQVDVLRPMAGQITWNPSRDLTRGIYFDSITSPNPAVVKIVLLR